MQRTILSTAACALVLSLFFSLTVSGSVAAVAAPSSLSDSTLRVMTFNLRFSNPGDGPNAWPHRKEMAASMIRFYEADLVGVQEALLGQLEDLKAQLPRYEWVGVGRADGKNEGEFSAILYRADRLELLDHNTFWLSETPDSVGSVGWDAAMERIATWGRFRDRTTGQVFYLFNTHFDHVGEQARAESARLIRQRIHQVAGDAPVVLTGDFNALEDSQPYQVLTGEGAPGPALRDAFYATQHPHHGPTSTWNGFQAIEPDRRIDFVFVGDEVQVRQHGILDDTWDGRFPSDHLPVLAEIRLPS